MSGQPKDLNGFGALSIPLFASSTMDNKGTDNIDYSEIFADFFNDLQEPMFLPALPNGIKNPQHGNSQTLAGVQGKDILPTRRGIKTAWHTGMALKATPATITSDAAIQDTGTPIHELNNTPTQDLDIQASKKLKKEFTDLLTEKAFYNSHEPVTEYNNNHREATPKGNNSICGNILPMNAKSRHPSVLQNGNHSIMTSNTHLQLPVGIGIRLGNVFPQATSFMADNCNKQKRPTISIPSAVSNNQLVLPASGCYSLPLINNKTAVNQDPTQQQMDLVNQESDKNRKQRNREHAKQSRVRKKFLLESLQVELSKLQKENQRLRLIVQAKIPQHAQSIIDESCPKSPFFFDVPNNETKKSSVVLTKADYSLVRSVSIGQQTFILSDPRLPDNPIIFASPGFYHLTGYTQDQVLGRNCRFLQGPNTEQRAIEAIRAAIQNGIDITICLLNYKADGTPFWNQLFVAALRDSENCVVNYVGVLCEVESESAMAALEEKVNSVLPLQMRGDKSET